MFRIPFFMYRSYFWLPCDPANVFHGEPCEEGQKLGETIYMHTIETWGLIYILKLKVMSKCRQAVPDVKEIVA